MGLIKKYETDDLIGTGSMGSVYHARDIVLDRCVALKILHAGADLDSELKERFYREARTGAKLRHPNIVIVYELDEFNGIPFMAMELLTGADVRRYILDKRPLPLAQKVELLAQICDGLAEAHRHGIVHRDIKPSNIYLHEERTAKVLDFGIAQLPSSKLTLCGKVLGTPNYMAPEQITGNQCDPRSDLFSAAIVFYEFLVYTHPFQSTFIPRRITEEEPDSLFDRDPLIPKTLAELLYKGLKKNPAQRIQSAGEFAVGLRSVLQELRSGLATESVGSRYSTQGAGGQSSPRLEESSDGRIAALIQYLANLDKALADEDIAAAQGALNKMKRLQSIDGRFTEAVEVSQRKLDHLKSKIGPCAVAIPAVPAPVESAAPKVVRSTDAWDDTYAIYGANLLSGEEPEGAPVEAAEVVQRSNEKQTDDDSTLLDSQFGRPSPRDRAAIRDRIKGYIAYGREAVEQRLHILMATLAVGAALAVAVVAIAAALFRPVPVVRAVGSAEVEAVQTELLAERRPGSKRLATLAKGSRVNVLSGIKSLHDSFVQVQFISEAAISPPGFVWTSDLGHWTSKEPSTAWLFLGFIRPTADGPESDVRDYIERLYSFGNRFKGTPQAADANLERARLYLSLATRRKSAAEPRTAWLDDVGRASEALEGAGPANPVEMADLRQKLESFNTDLSAPPAQAQPSSVAAAAEPPEAARHLRNASTLWEEGDLDGVEAEAKRVLLSAPSNVQARAWLYQVGKAREALK